MKKTLLTLGVSAAFICCTLAYAASSSPVNGLDSSTLRIDRPSLVVNPTKALQKNSAKKTRNRVKEEVSVDLWYSADEILPLNEGGVYTDSATIVFPGSAEQTNQIFTGAVETDGGLNYAWYADPMMTYTFTGHITSTGDATVRPCILYMDSSEQLFIYSNTNVWLTEENNHGEYFSVSAHSMPENSPVLVAFIISGSAPEVNIEVGNINFGYSYSSQVAEAWTAESDTLPGLGLQGYEGYAYTVKCEDEVTTLGIYYDGTAYVTGINTTASEVRLPENVTINGTVTHPSYFGFNGTMDWSGAQSVTSLHLEPASQIDCYLSGSSVKDVYISNNCQVYGDYSANSEAYLHIPYGAARSNYSHMGFKRVLVGQETPSYPEPVYASWVIADENGEDYYGISIVDDNLCLAEVFSEKDSLAVPATGPGPNDDYYYITRLGADYNYSYGAFSKNAPNLRTLTVPETYNYIGISWTNNNITDLHMAGDVPSTRWNVPVGVNVYVREQNYYSNYENSSNWSNANILPDGWEFEWMNVNVGRKGEFAQTYIEMTDADWSQGVYVKVTGTLNATDLTNMKNLTKLRKLDLTEATFDALPESFMISHHTLQEIMLPEALTYISGNAFNSCSKLTKVTAPGVTTLDNYSFNYCQSLREFDISNVTYIGQNAFATCRAYAPAALSSGLTYIGSSAFNNTAITEAILPEGLTTFGSSAFSNCSKLTKVVLPSTITAIPSNAFYSCSQLAEINLPEGITNIDYRAFNSCQNLTEIVIPSTVQSVGYGVFDYCTSLTTVKSKAIVPPATEGIFTESIDMNHCTLYVAPFAIDAYRDADNWSSFFIMKPLDEPVKNIYINRPMTFDLLSEDNAVLQENPNMTLDYDSSSSYYKNSNVGQLSASGDGTLSAGIFTLYHSFYSRQSSGSDYRTTLVNNAENMRADSVLCSVKFEKNRWHFISFQYDVRMSDIYGLNSTDFVIRSYNSINRASGDGTTSNWEDVPADGILEAGQGYIIQAANNTTNDAGNTHIAVVRFPSRNTVTKNRLFTSNNVIVPLAEYPAEFAHNRSWNLVGNPYPCYYDMHCLMDDFTTPVVIWRGTSYQAYSPVDDDLILRPNEAFFVQRPLDAEQMVFGAEGRMHYAEAYDVNTTPGIRSPRKAAAAGAQRSVFNFNIEGCGSDDRARIVMNEDATMGYDMSFDASKFFAETAQGAEIYVDGDIRYDICERPFENGTAALGLRTAERGIYTISLTGRNTEGWTVVLTDTETGESTVLTDKPYSFEANAGTTAGRFVVTFRSPAQSAVNGIDASAQAENVRVVNTAGIVVFEGTLDAFKASAQPGVYVVVSDGSVEKTVIK